jgi:hypothetical protein
MNAVEISAKDVKALRDRTGAGMMDCKKALTEAVGDLEKAIEILRLRQGKKIQDLGASAPPPRAPCRPTSTPAPRWGC